VPSKALASDIAGDRLWLALWAVSHGCVVDRRERAQLESVATPATHPPGGSSKVAGSTEGPAPEPPWPMYAWLP